MTPHQFIAKWRDNPLSERAGAQAFFLDLCALLGVAAPNDPDHYCFERGATRTGAGQGWADVWKRGHFGWENKGPGGALGGALKQLMTYALALDNPPLLVVSNRDVTQIHTHFTGTPSETHTIRLEDIGTPDNLQKLRWLFTDPERFRPGRTVQDITADAAGRFAAIAQSMTGRGHDPQQVAHFLIQCLFCMFAEDIELLPKQLFERVMAKRGAETGKLMAALGELFRAMQSGGDFLLEDIAWFNGGLFARVDLIELTPGEVAALHAASKMDWSAIEPSILGTLFERGLDPKIRAPLGANYTDPGTIMKLVNPVIVEPLAREWAQARARIGPLVAKYHAGGRGSQSAWKEAQALFLGYIERLKNFRVLDPACGSGNFLYLSLRALKDLEHRANLDAEALGLPRQLAIETSPANVLGIEINAYAAELARVTVWVGEIQWMLKNGYDFRRNPILAPLDHIEHRDALLNADGSEAAWPRADVIVGNPPFLGDKMMRGELGDDYVESLRRRYAGRVPGGADLVTYWFEKSRAQIAAGGCERAGLVATNSIRQKRNRVVLERILQSTHIFEAWSDEDWVNEGAAVRVSLVCFGQAGIMRLDGNKVALIHADLTGSAEDSPALDLTQARPLAANKESSYFGICLAGPFKVDTTTALAWLRDTGNPNGRPNSDVMRPIYNGSDITRRWAGNWVVDFAARDQADAADYLAPFAYVEAYVKPKRITNNRAARAEKWWQHGEKRPAMRAALNGLTCYIVTPETAKHRFFVRFPVQVAPEHKLIVIPRQDDVTLGVLSSRIHCLWAIEKGGRLGVGNDPVYNSSLCFETFPFPLGLDLKRTVPPTGGVFQVIAQAAADLDAWREKWLNPEGWLEWEITPEEQSAGLPPRPVPRPEHAREWKLRTLTNLYNDMPAGLKLRQQRLDDAVAAAYGWSDYTPAMPDEEILRRLLALNRQRSAAG
ncbi:MAG TPA: N-6 DNA methylase [Accumulibacter sp.]|nr:N-6 DNA methylase [Accumulibacter sp.]